MATVAATCPVCHGRHNYPGEMIGRYTLCAGCGARFYVEVPPLAETAGRLVIAQPDVVGPDKRDTTLDDLRLDAQKGTEDILRWLRRQESNAKVMRWLIVVVILLAVSNLAGVALLLLRP